MKNQLKIIHGGRETFPPEELTSIHSISEDRLGEYEDNPGAFLPDYDPQHERVIVQKPNLVTKGLKKALGLGKPKVYLHRTKIPPTTSS